jgi:hypothetical protein
MDVLLGLLRFALGNVETTTTVGICVN